MTTFDSQPDPVEMLLAVLDDLAHGADQRPDPLVEPSDGEINIYDIDLDETASTPDALAARDRILANLGLPTPPLFQEDQDGNTQESVDVTFCAIIAANLWNEADTGLVVARRGGYSLPTRDLTVPDLAGLGYRPEVEVEIDLEPNGESATLTFLLESDQEFAPSQRVRLVLETESGFQTRASVSTMGVAVLRGIPRHELQNLQLRWEAA